MAVAASSSPYAPPQDGVQPAVGAGPGDDEAEHDGPDRRDLGVLEG